MFGQARQPTPQELLDAHRRSSAPAAPGTLEHEQFLALVEARAAYIAASPECKRRKFCDNVIAPGAALGLVGGSAWLAKRQWGWGAAAGAGFAALVVASWTNMINLDLMATSAKPSPLCAWSWGPCREVVRRWDAEHS